MRDGNGEIPDWRFRSGTSSRHPLNGRNARGKTGNYFFFRLDGDFADVDFSVSASAGEINAESEEFCRIVDFTVGISSPCAEIGIVVQFRHINFECEGLPAHGELIETQDLAELEDFHLAVDQADVESTGKGEFCQIDFHLDESFLKFRNVGSGVEKEFQFVGVGIVPGQFQGGIAIGSRCDLRSLFSQVLCDKGDCRDRLCRIEYFQSSGCQGVKSDQQNQR